MAGESRRCTASQFFVEEDEKAMENVSTYDRVSDRQACPSIIAHMSLCTGVFIRCLLDV